MKASVTEERIRYLRAQEDLNRALENRSYNPKDYSDIIRNAFHFGPLLDIDIDGFFRSIEFHPFRIGNSFLILLTVCRRNDERVRDFLRFMSASRLRRGVLDKALQLLSGIMFLPLREDIRWGLLESLYVLPTLDKRTMNTLVEFFFLGNRFYLLEVAGEALGGRPECAVELLQRGTGSSYGHTRSRAVLRAETCIRSSRFCNQSDLPKAYSSLHEAHFPKGLADKHLLISLYAVGARSRRRIEHARFDELKQRYRKVKEVVAFETWYNLSLKITAADELVYALLKTIVKEIRVFDFESFFAILALDDIVRYAPMPLIFELRQLLHSESTGLCEIAVRTKDSIPRKRKKFLMRALLHPSWSYWARLSDDLLAEMKHLHSEAILG